MGYREETVMVCFNCRAKADMYATTCRNCGRPQTAVPMRKKPSMDARSTGALPSPARSAESPRWCCSSEGCTARGRL